MKTFTKHILLLALMLFGVAGAAWASRAPQKFTGPVDIYSLVQGDTLAPGFSLTYGHDQSENIYFANGRYSENGTPQATPYNGVLTDPDLLGISFTASNIIFHYAQEGFDTIAPMVDMNTPGNAWVVSDIYRYVEGVELTLSGIEIVIDYPVQDANGNWNFLMPGSNKVVKVTYKAQPALAWTYGNRAIPNDTTITAYRGFEMPVIGSIGAIMDHDFLTALLGGTVSLRFGSTNPAVISFTDPNNMWSVSVNGAGECNVYMVFDGNDDYQYDSVAFHAVIANPYTLTLAANNDNMGSVKIAESIDTVYNITLEQSGISGDNRSFTIPASRFPYDTTFSYNANITFAYAYDQMGGSVDIFAQGDNWITVRISGPFQYGGYYSCELDGGGSDNWSISCTATGTQPKMPYGITKTGDNTYSVLPGTEVQVVATAVDGAHVSAWSPINRTPENLLSDTATFTVGETMTLTATFAQNPLLTLASNNSEWGTVTLDGITPGVTTYNITISENPYPDVTYTNVSFPFHTTVFIHEGLDEVEAVDQTPLIAVKNGDNADITINGPYGGTIEYSYNNHEGAGHKAIFCEAVPGLPIMPEGVTYAGYDTYLVLPGTTVNVTATPDSAHYFKNWTGEADAISNEAVVKTLTMGQEDVDLTANFAAKPTLTLAQTDGGTLAAIVPQGEPVLLTTIIPSSNALITNSQTNDTVTVTLAGDLEWGNGGWIVQYGDGYYGSVSVTAAAGFDIAYYKFYFSYGDSYIDSVAPYAVYPYFDDLNNGHYIYSQLYGQGQFIGEGAVTRIEVYTPGTANVIASSTPNTYIIDYGTPVTVVATPDAQHYLVSFSDDDPATERNSNIAVEKTYDSVIADINLQANFQAKPTLTLTANEGGTLTLDGVNANSSDGYTIKFSANGNTIVKENVTLPKTYRCDYGSPSEFDNIIRELYGWTGVHGNENATPTVTGTDAITPGLNSYSNNYPQFTINSVFEGTATVTIGYTNSSWVSDDWPIEISFVPALPDGVVSANATADTFVVDYGTTLTVTATPDSIHYLKNFVGGVTLNSNTAKDTTFTVTATTNLAANFTAKPTLTLAHNDGGEMEAIVPQAEPVLLTTVTATGETSYSQSPDGIVTVTLNNTNNYAGSFGWLENGTVTVEAAQGYTITRCVFRQNEKTPLEDDLAPFTATMESFNVSAETSTGQENSGVMDGISSIEVYGYQNVTPNVIASTTEPNTYYIDYGTDVTVKATPDATHYLVNFDGTDVRNDNDTATKVYTNVTAPFTSTANFNAKPTLALTSNEGGEMSLPGYTPSSFTPSTIDVISWDGVNAWVMDEDMPTDFTPLSQAEILNWQSGIEGNYIVFYRIQASNSRAVFAKFDNGAYIGSYYIRKKAVITDYLNQGYQVLYTNNYSPAVFPEGVVAANNTLDTFVVNYGANVTVKATPSDTTYLVRFDNDADTNSNVAVEKTYQNITADVTSEALFAPKPTLTLAANDTTWGKMEIPIGLVATDPTPAPTPTAVANPVITGVLMPDGSMQVTMSCTTQDADIYYTTDGVTSPYCDCSAAPEYTHPITFTEPVTIMAAAYTGNDWSAVVTKTITLSLPDGVAKLTDSTYRVDYGASVTVQAIPDTAHYLVRFDNDADTNSNVAVEKTYQNITADVTSEALFAPKPKLTLAKTRTMDDTDDWGSVSFNPLQYPYLGSSQNTGPLFLTDEPDVYVVDYGATVTVTADATELHHVANWVDADSAAYPADRITYSAYFVTEPVALFPDSSTLTLTITADTTAKAVFGINSYDVFATAQLDDRDEIGTGTAMGYLNVSYKDIVGTTQTAGPEDTLDYTAQGGSLSTLSSTSYYGYRFSGWYDADMDTLMSSVNPLTLTEAAVVEARYTPINYTITGLSENDEMGTVTGGGTLPYRTPVSLTAVPERGYHFTGWDNGLSANPLELAAMSDFTVTASFAPNQYTVTVLSGDETMGSASGSTVADFHTTVTLTATPNAHYHFVAWSNGVTDTVTELLVDGDTTVTALFAADEYTITGLSADSTMGSVSGSATVTYPATVTLTATAANCHHFVQWNDGVTANPRTVNALEDLTLTATFAASTYASSEDVTTCDSYTWNNVTYTASGTYTYNTTTLAGCDSTATLHLTLITGIETEEVVEACESYEWHGVVYTQSTGILGAPTYTTTALNGCDSTVTLRLTINHGTTAVETVEACDSYTWNGRTYFSSTTTATYTTEGSNGCDSTTTLHLTLGRSTSGELNVEACESYTWHGVTYTESIVGPTDTNLNTSGCPHVTTLHLTILRNSSSEETVEACDVYNWHGVNRYASGDYVFLSPNAVGCDSTAILHLTILRSTHAEEIAAACDEYEWHGILFTESADTTLHTLNAAGCDSAMTLHLTLYYNSEATDVVTACDSYTWIDGVTYTASTDEPTYTLSGANCSTTVTLNLTVNYSTAGIDEQEAVDSYTWINGITYTASTDQPTFVLTNAAGCDSVVTLHLTITYTPEPVYYNVTLATADATMGSVAPAGTTVIEEGLSFTATATALTGRHFVAWVSNGTVVSNANPYTFVVNDDVELTATFDYDEVIAVLTVNDETMGTTTPAPGTYTFHVGDEATVTATANEHYHFAGWTVNGTPINTQETTYTVTVTPEMAGMTFYVEAVFAQNEGIDDNEGTLEATIYAQEGQIVVEGAGNSTVVLYDVTGRRLAVKHSDNAPLRFDIAVSGTYLVKVGNAPAKRIVMVR